MFSFRLLPRRPRHGFSLLELMIVVAIVAILAAIAYPSYTAYVLKSRRADALTALTQTQVMLERCYAQNFSYIGCAGLPSASPQGYYSVSAVPAPTATTYTVSASPTGTQAADTTCATMSVDQTNTKLATDTGGTSQPVCWNP